VAQAVKAKAGNLPVYWIQGQACTGCSVSLLNATYPDIAETLLDIISLKFHPNVMGIQGEGAIRVLNQAKTNPKIRGKFLLVVEGSVPTGEAGFYCTVGEHGDKPITIESWVKELGTEAKAVVSVGSCASFGGIPSAPPNPTSAKPVKEIIPKATVINIPGCPPHPDWMIGTIAHVILFGLPKLDKFSRPVMFFGSNKLIHENCERRAYFDKGEFAKKFSEDGCLYELGCKGPVTYSDCPTRAWNGGVNWCIRSGSPCIGCTEEDFPGETAAALYAKLPPAQVPGFPSINVTADKIGVGLGILTAAGILGHAVGRIATKGTSEKKGETP
jgi:hydrogenase small subunit